MGDGCRKKNNTCQIDFGSPHYDSSLCQIDSVLHITRTRLRNLPVRKLLPLNAFQVKVSSAVFSSVLSSLLSLLAGTGSKPGNDSSDTKSTTKTPRPIIVQECDVTPSKWSAHVSINSWRQPWRGLWWAVPRHPIRGPLFN